MIIVFAMILAYIAGFYIGKDDERYEQFNRDMFKQAEYERHFWNATTHEIDK